jgi:hypothetical protein
MDPAWRGVSASSGLRSYYSDSSRGLTNDEDSASRNNADASLSRTLPFRCVVS